MPYMYVAGILTWFSLWRTCHTLLCSYLIHFLTICRRFEIIWTNIHLLRIFFLKTVEFGNWLFLITICLQPFTTFGFEFWFLINTTKFVQKIYKNAKILQIILFKTSGNATVNETSFQNKGRKIFKEEKNDGKML